MVGTAARYHEIHGVFELIHRVGQERIGGGGIRKAHHADLTASADLSRRTAGGLGNDVDKGFGTDFHSGKRRPCHTARPVQHQHNIGGIRYNIRRRGERQSHFERAVAFNAVGVDDFIGIGYTHLSFLLLRGVPPAMLCVSRKVCHRPAAALSHKSDKICACILPRRLL